jgi:hypothetical protein
MGWALFRAIFTNSSGHPARNHNLPLIFFKQEQLDQKLEQRQARETGICQVNSF